MGDTLSKLETFAELVASGDRDPECYSIRAHPYAIDALAMRLGVHPLPSHGLADKHHLFMGIPLIPDESLPHNVFQPMTYEEHQARERHESYKRWAAKQPLGIE